MKKLLTILILLLASLAVAQNTSVTGQVTDGGGQAWNNGTFSFTFVGPQSVTWTGGAFNPNAPITGSLSASGAIPATNVPDNNQITPAGTQWQVRACSATLPQTCFSTIVTITGAAQTVNLTPGAIKFLVPTVPTVIAPISGYADAEIQGGWVGFTYYNLVSTGLRVCTVVTLLNCSSFVAVSGGGGFPGSGTNPFVATSTLQLPAGACPNPALAMGGSVDGIYQFGTDQIGICSNGFVAGNFNSSAGLSLNQSTFISWCTTAVGTCLNGDTGVHRGAAGVLFVDTGVINPGQGRVKAAGYITVGTTFTSSGGCTEGTLIGGATAGRFTTSGSTSCTTTITMGNSATAPDGWQCSATDITTVADAANPHMTTSNATTATIATGTIVAGDVISFSCNGN